jgi:hypothetical protein
MTYATPTRRILAGREVPALAEMRERLYASGPRVIASSTIGSTRSVQGVPPKAEWENDCKPVAVLLQETL